MGAGNRKLTRELIGEYEVGPRFAVGGMAELFIATSTPQAGAPRKVVLKKMLPRLSKERGAREMFEEEARLGKRIRHTNVVEVLDHGTTADSQPYLVLEYVPGCDLWRLRRWLSQHKKRLPVELAVYVVRQLLNGLSAVHNATEENGVMLEIVHRDVSPSNVMLSVHGEVKLADFGIARTKLREHFPIATLDDRAKGKLGYLAPEQVIGRPIDLRADIFAAGVIAAELLMGQVLFSGASELAILLAIRDADITPYNEISSAFPAELNAVISMALSREPESRYATAAAFADALAPFQTGDDLDLADEVGNLVAEASERSHAPVNFTPTITATDHDSDEYRILTRTGEQIGPWTFAQLVEAVATGKVQLEDKLQENSGEFIPIGLVPKLSRHMPTRSKTPITREHTVEMKPVEALDFADTSVARALAKSAMLDASGMWLCKSAQARKEIFVEDGVPRYVTSNQASELLGEYLIRQRVLQRGELDMALAVMPRFDGRLGDTLVALGLVDPIDLFQHIAEQVRQRLLDLFLWKEGSMTFFPEVSPPPSSFPLALDPWHIILAGTDLRQRSKMIVIPPESYLITPTNEFTRPLPDDLQTAKELVGDHSRVLRFNRLMEKRHGLRRPEAELKLLLLMAIGAVNIEP